MSDKHIRGKSGEAEAKRFLEQKGYVILHTNWHFGHYELDIVATKEDELVIVEVKTRGVDFLISPEEAVNKGKITRLVAAANAYVRYFRLDMPVRFDIITLVEHTDEFEIDHIEDAFYAPLKRR